MMIQRQSPRIVRLVLRRDKLQRAEAKRRGGLAKLQKQARREEEVGLSSPSCSRLCDD